jgi:hypothetical protein
LAKIYHKVYFFYFTRVKRRQNQSFVFEGKKYNYFCSFYNYTCENERIVEIPIIMEWVAKNKGKEILEVGNVLSHYFGFTHDILDKYEIAEGIINEDVIDFKPDKTYDLIVSISTLEHVGWDESLKDAKKIMHAVENLKGICNPAGGKIVMTFPLGYNPALDELLKNGLITLDEKYFLKRISKLNEWKQVSWNEVQNAKFGQPYRYGNAIVVGVIYPS